MTTPAHQAVHESTVTNDVEIAAVPDGYINVSEDTHEPGAFNRDFYDGILVVVPEAVVITPGQPFEL